MIYRERLSAADKLHNLHRCRLADRCRIPIPFADNLPVDFHSNSAGIDLQMLEESRYGQVARDLPLLAIQNNLNHLFRRIRHKTFPPRRLAV